MHAGRAKFGVDASVDFLLDLAALGMGLNLKIALTREAPPHLGERAAFSGDLESPFNYTDTLHVLLLARLDGRGINWS